MSINVYDKQGNVKKIAEIDSSQYVSGLADIDGTKINLQCTCNDFCVTIYGYIKYNGVKKDIALGDLPFLQDIKKPKTDYTLVSTSSMDVSPYHVSNPLWLTSKMNLISYKAMENVYIYCTYAV